MKTNVVHTTEYDIHKEGEENVDPYKCIINTGCSKTVTGRVWMDAFTKENNVKMEIRKEKESLKFGSSGIHRSGEN